MKLEKKMGTWGDQWIPRGKDSGLGRSPAMALGDSYSPRKALSQLPSPTRLHPIGGTGGAPRKG